MSAYKIGIVGAGTMGTGIALVASAAGMQVVLSDIQQRQLDAARSYIENAYRRRVERGVLTTERLRQALGLVGYSLTYDDLHDAAVVIEAVPEEVELKKTVFEALGQLCQPETILATNTSALSVAELSESSGRPQRAIGMHFFNPVPAMRLVEVIPGPSTDPAVTDSIVELARKLGKAPVVVQDRPGFLVNRVLMPYLNEAVMCLQEDAATVEEIDAALGRSGFGWPMGPLALMDTVGLDVCHHIASYMAERYGGRLPEAALLKMLFEEGRYGRKSGSGFYEYAGAMRPTDLSLFVSQLHEQGVVQAGPMFSVDRVMMPFLNEAFRCVEEEVASIEDVDLACMAGLGMQVRTGDQVVARGPLGYADDRGLDVILRILEGLHAQLGERFRPAATLVDKVQAGSLGVKSGRGFVVYRH